MIYPKTLQTLTDPYVEESFASRKSQIESDVMSLGEEQLAMLVILATEIANTPVIGVVGDLAMLTLNPLLKKRLQQIKDEGK